MENNVSVSISGESKVVKALKSPKPDAIHNELIPHGRD